MKVAICCLICNSYIKQQIATRSLGRRIMFLNYCTEVQNDFLNINLLFEAPLRSKVDEKQETAYKYIPALKLLHLNQDQIKIGRHKRAVWEEKKKSVLPNVFLIGKVNRNLVVLATNYRKSLQNKKKMLCALKNFSVVYW